MATLNFPLNPVNGQTYPSTPVVGENLYEWQAAYQTWILVGTVTGVTQGTYGSSTSVARFTVDWAGNISFAENVPIQLGDTTRVGLVQLTDNTTSNDSTTALTAAQGYNLQTQIGDTALLNPPAPDLVTAINAAAAGSATSAEYLTLDNISGFFNGVNTTFTLRYQGNPYTPTPQTNLMVFVGGVVQLPKPTGSYTVTGSSISFDSPPPTGASFYATTIVLVN